MRQTDKILLTGITGTVGSWLAAEALNSGKSVLAIMRGKDEAAARERLRSVLYIAGALDHIDHVDIIRADICEDMSGIADNLKTADISMFFHCAASTDFSQSSSELNRRTNVGGTENALKLATKLNVPICYISTAYIAGRRQGIVKESDIDTGQEFNNVYEQTKCEAEVLVHKWTAESSLPAFVIRPSIVIGDSHRGRIANFNGMYNILRFFDAVGPIIGDEQIRVVAKSDATKNFVPVDYLAKAVWHIVDHGVGGTYHITNPKPLTLEEMQDIYEHLFNLKGKIVDEDDFKHKKATRAERLYRKSSSLYEPYMAGEPIFDRSNTDAVLRHTNLEIPVIDNAYFARLLEYAKSVQWGKLKLTQPKLSSHSIAAIERYFDVFLANKIDKQLLPNLRNLSATFCIVLKDNPDIYWSLAIKHGTLTLISRNSIACECSFLVNADTFGRISSGRISPQQAFFKKQVDITGDIETGMKLVAVLATFFRKYPYDIERQND